MADKHEQEEEQRPFHISLADEVLEQQESGGPGTIHAEDGSEQPRLDDMAKHPHGRSSGQSAPSNRPLEVGQFTGEGQPSRQKK